MVAASIYTPLPAVVSVRSLPDNEPFASVAAPDALVSVIVAELVGFVRITDRYRRQWIDRISHRHILAAHVPAISGATGVGVGPITSKLVFVSVVARLDVVSVTSSSNLGFSVCPATTATV